MHGPDEVDRRLLALLQADDRVPVAELGKGFGVAASTLNDQMGWPVRRGVITGFHAQVSPEKFRLDLLAFVLVGWSNPGTEKQFLDVNARAPEVQEYQHVTSAWKDLIRVRLKSKREREPVLPGVIREVPGL